MVVDIYFSFFICNNIYNISVRLIIENTENKKIKELTYIISISSIFIGILITIVTGYIKFNDYQNKLEIISSRLSLLLQYQKNLK